MDNFQQTRSVNEDESSVLDFIIMFGIFGFAAFGIYLSFLIFGALAGSFLPDAAMRAVTAGVLAFLLPLVVSLGSLGNEQNRVAMRMSKLAMSTFIVSIGSAVLVCLFLTDHIADNLYDNPNWFMGRNVDVTTSKLAHTNDELSEALADVAEVAAEKTGTYTRRERTGHRVIGGP